jgi:exodeoxyribonuclease VII small subunit
MEKELTYAGALEELEAILKELESAAEVNMDKISVRVKRASELMQFCRKQLFELDQELEKTIRELE